jgi:hypothetical protein
MMEKHNGYTNYATWLVALHIGQDNDDQEFYTARGRWYNNNPVIEGGIDFTVYTFGWMTMAYTMTCLDMQLPLSTGMILQSTTRQQQLRRTSTIPCKRVGGDARPPPYLAFS